MPKFRNVFGADEPYNPYGRIRFGATRPQIYQEPESEYEEGPAIRAYMQHMAGLPNREAYQPNIGSKIAASLAGFSAGYRQGPQAGIEASEAITERPYRRALEDWGMREQGLRAQAELEDDREARRNAYRKIMMESGQWQGEQSVREHQADTSRMIAEQTAKRDAATDERTRKYYDALIRNMTNTRANELKRIKISEDNLAARNRAIDLYGDRTKAISGRPESATQLAAARRIATEEAMNEMPAEAFNDQGRLKPEFAGQLETLIQLKLSRRRPLIYDIELPSFGDENEFELLEN